MNSLTQELTPAQKYDAVYRSPDYAKPEASIGFKLAPWVCNRFRFQTVLDVGCGSGHALIKFLQHGKTVTGTEISTYLLEGRLKNFAEQKMVFKSGAEKLPFQDKQFDMVYCTEVLEHIVESDVAASLAELWRVTNHYVFMTVCFRASKFLPILNLHETIQPAAWWEDQFRSAGMNFKRFPDSRREGAFYVAERV